MLPEILRSLTKHELLGFVGEEALQDIPRLSPRPPSIAEQVFKYYQGAIEYRQRSKGKDEWQGFGPEFESVKCLVRLPEQTRALMPQIKELFQSKDEYVRAESAAILAAVDPDGNEKAVNHLIHIMELLAHPRDPVDREAVKELDAERRNRFPDGLGEVIISAFCSSDKLAEKHLAKLIKWYRHQESDYGVQADALRQVFQRLGPQAKAAGPALIDTLDNYYVPDVLVTLGPDMVPLLIAKVKALQAEDNGTRLNGLEILAKFGDQAAPALPLFFEALESPELQYRIRVIEALGTLRGLSEQVVPELLKTLRDKRCLVRAAAATSLGQFKDRREVIVPALIAALSDDYADVRAAALESLLKFGLNHPGLRDVVQQAKQDRHPYVRLLATEALN